MYIFLFLFLFFFWGGGFKQFRLAPAPHHDINRPSANNADLIKDIDSTKMSFVVLLKAGREKNST